MSRLLAAAPLLALALSPAAAARSGGAVATADPQATRVGLEILEAGGNAADAAVAAALVLAVSHPQAGNLAGGGFAVGLFDGEPFALDFREAAPAAAHRALYLDEAGEPRPGASLLGPLATGVPGTPDGLFALHGRFGRLPWSRVVRPAASLAERGFTVRPRLARSLAWAADELATFASSRAAWLEPAGPLPAGTRVRRPELARSLRDYARHGPRALTEGRIAAAIVAASEGHGGILSLEDLAGYEPVWREPVRFPLGDGWSVASMNLPSSGGLILAQGFALLERFPPAAAGAGPGDRAHRLVEAWRRSYADRFAMGDPEAGLSVTGDQLLEPGWLDRRAASFRPGRATASADVLPHESLAPRAAGESAETTHLSVVDGDGAAVALTTTLNGGFGSKLWVPEVGFLNNEMDDFTTAPGKPNLYGLVQGPANEVQPGRRMLSSMSPTVAWRGDAVLALGSPGGSRIPTAVFQVLRRVLLDGQDLQAAVDAPRLHHQWRPDRIDFEPGALDPWTLGELRSRGHALQVRPGHGEVHAVQRMPGGGFAAAADPRGPGAAGRLVAQPVEAARSSARQ